MADIEETIYKLSIDPAGYVAGVNACVESTNKLTVSQEKANKALEENEASLKLANDNLAKANKLLDNYSGSSEKYRKQLESSVKKAAENQIKLTEVVNNSRKAYDIAAKAAADFAANAAKATQLGQGGKIPTGVPPGIKSPVVAVEGIPQNIQEFEQLAFAIQLAETRMAELDETSEEFQLLKPIVEQGKQALELYGKATDEVAGKTQSLRSRIKEGKEELTRMEEAGESGTKQFAELEQQVASLTDQYGDQQARIKILSSDTKALDFGKEAITSAVSAFQVYTSVSILAGEESEELQKKTMQLFAAMQLLTSLEQLANTVRREGKLATLASAAAQSVYTAVVGATTGALRAFRVALLATGIGAAVIGIGLLIAALNRHNKATDEASKKKKIFDDINKEAAKTYVAEVTHLEVIRSKLVDLSIPQEQRVELAKEYNKTAEEGNKIDLKQIDNIDLVNAAIDRNIAKIKERAIAKAAENVIAQKAEALLLKQFGLQKDFANVFKTEKDFGGEFDPEQELINLGKNTGARNIQKNIVKANALKDFIELKEDLNRAIQVAGGLISVDSLFTTDEAKATKTGGAKATQIENVFAQTLNGLLTRLRAAGKKEIESVTFIQDEFTDKLVAEIDNIDELVSKKQLTKKQGDFLVKILEAVIGKESDAAVALLKDRVVKAISQLQDELTDLDIKRAQDEVSLIEGEFAQRAAQIDLNEKQQTDAVTEAGKERLKVLDELNASEILTEEEYAANRLRIETGMQLDILNIQRRAAQERQKLSEDSLKRAQEQAVELEEAFAALAEPAPDDDGEKKTPKSTFEEWAKAIGTLAESVIGFWQKANEAESQALDRSISLQEKRVEAAQRIAARGNAQYLKQEEDRLKELQVQKENAARRELAINAALQASQLLVGITGAISHLASGPLGAAAVIADIAVIVGALAAGYGLVKSLQGSQPKLAGGTKNLRRGNNPAGTDTIPAWLNEGEAVIPTGTNKAYHPTIEAIYDGTIPADRINNFVNTYHRTKGVPRPNYDRIRDAAEISIGADGRLLEELKENNSLQRQTLRAMKNMAVSATIDRDGVAIAVNEYMNQMEIDKRV